MVSPALAGEMENTAMSALFSSMDLTSAKVLIPPAAVPKIVNSAKPQSAQSWIAEVKKAYAGYVENSELFTLPEAKKSELPAAALKQLKQDNAEQHSWSAPYSSTAYKLMVKGQLAFVIQNERDGHNMTVHIFNASGQLIAVGNADEATPLHWDKINTASVGASSSCNSPDSSGYGGPGYGTGSGPDAIDDGSGHGVSGGGPDDTSYGGCGGTGSGGGSDPDGSGSGVLF